jgi:hypothetical protein
MRSVGAVLLVVMLGASATAGAEERRQPEGLFAPSRLVPLVRRAIEAAPAPPRARGSVTAGAPRRDSIWNGGLIGAAIGGVGGSALIVASRGGSDDIPRAMLNVCLPPALGGFAVGAIVDALR